MKHMLTIVLTSVLSVLASWQVSKPAAAATEGEPKLRLGNFSISLAVKDLSASRAFYEKLGFRPVGKPHGKYAILQNETATIGLFEGMFDKNSLTFNPGWDRDCKTLPDFDDVREIQRRVKELGLTPVVAADEKSDGTAFFTLVDPDGNPVLIDQHVPRPKK